jgi:hypothetical protein
MGRYLLYSYSAVKQEVCPWVELEMQRETGWEGLKTSPQSGLPQNPWNKVSLQCSIPALISCFILYCPSIQWLKTATALPFFKSLRVRNFYGDSRMALLYSRWGQLGLGWQMCAFTHRSSASLKWLPPPWDFHLGPLFWLLTRLPDLSPSSLVESTDSVNNCWWMNFWLMKRLRHRE